MRFTPSMCLASLKIYRAVADLEFSFGAWFQVRLLESLKASGIELTVRLFAGAGPKVSKAICCNSSAFSASFPVRLC